ncbi:hypothetical protein BC829DRAFT_388870 [Chytridium lagenaria]|nr:hypothetical protein BC829DRAFT_388870 [Chytridium lagenaria]
MSSSPSLYSVIQPFHACAGLALLRAGIITGSSCVVLIILKILFNVFVFERREGPDMLPSKEDTIVFGICTFILLRTTTASVFARNRPRWLPTAISPSFAFFFAGLTAYTVLALIWIYFPNVFQTAGDFVLKIYIPIYFIFAAMSNGFIYKVEFTKKSIYNLISSTVLFPVIFTIHLSVGTTCMIIANSRNQIYIEELKESGSNLKVSAEQHVLSLFLAGVLYPCVKVIVVWFNRKAFRMMSPPKPQTREQEILVNTTEFAFFTGQRLLWDTIGYILILRSPSQSIFFASLIATYCYNGIYRVGNALWMKRQSQKVQVDVAIADIETQIALPKYEYLSRQLQSRLTVKRTAPIDEDDPNDALAMKAFAASEAEDQDLMYKSKNGVSIRMILGDNTPEGGQGVPSRQTRVIKNASSLFAEQNTGYTSDIEHISSTNSANGQDDESLPTSKTSGHNLSPQELQQEDSSDPPALFIPLHQFKKHAFLRVGILTADWCAYWVACLIILLFVTIPEIPRWHVSYYEVTGLVFLTRFICGSAICASMDILTLFMEARILNLDFAEGVKESRLAKLSSGTYLYFVGMITCLAGIYLIADTGVLFTSPSYSAGRRRW